MSRWFYVGVGIAISTTFMFISHQQTENKAGGYANAPLERTGIEE